MLGVFAQLPAFDDVGQGGRGDAQLLRDRATESGMTPLRAATRMERTSARRGQKPRGGSWHSGWSAP